MSEQRATKGNGLWSKNAVFKIFFFLKKKKNCSVFIRVGEGLYTLRKGLQKNELGKQISVDFFFSHKNYFKLPKS